MEKRTVLVTGGTGFVCMGVAEKLLDEGHDVVLLARRKPLEGDFDELKGRKGSITFAQGDVLKPETIVDAINHNGVTDFVHGAAMTPNMDLEAEQGKQVMEINCIGTINALDAARATGIRRFLYLGSISGYGTTAFEVSHLVEDESVPKPNTLYELSKFTAERIVKRYRQLFSMEAYVLKIGVVFGPWEHLTGVRPFMSFPYQLTMHAEQGTPVALPRPCSEDWVYNRDIANSVYGLLEAKTLRYDTYPICSGFVWSIMDWCELLKGLYPDFKYELVSDPDKATIRINQSRDHAFMSTARLIEDSGYTPRYDLKRSFEDYMAWLKAHPGYLSRKKKELQFQ